MSTASSPSTCDCQRLRFRFRKEGDLRWISHRDLVRTWERLCRRAELVLRMSEGFHPKPKMSFPSALALGIEGQDEVMELALVTPMDPLRLSERLNSLAPAGLVITQVVPLDSTAGKARVRAMRYQFPVPAERRQDVEQAVQRLRTAPPLLIDRSEGKPPIDLLADLVSVALGDDTVCFSLRASDRASARPRDVLQALGLADLEQQGSFLTRSAVELATNAPEKPQ